MVYAWFYHINTFWSYINIVMIYRSLVNNAISIDFGHFRRIFQGLSAPWQDLGLLKPCEFSRQRAAKQSSSGFSRTVLQRSREAGDATLDLNSWNGGPGGVTNGMMILVMLLYNIYIYMILSHFFWYELIWCICQGMSANHLMMKARIHFLMNSWTRESVCEALKDS